MILEILKSKQQKKKKKVTMLPQQRKKRQNLKQNLSKRTKALKLVVMNPKRNLSHKTKRPLKNQVLQKMIMMKIQRRRKTNLLNLAQKTKTLRIQKKTLKTMMKVLKRSLGNQRRLKPSLILPKTMLLNLKKKLKTSNLRQMLLKIKLRQQEQQPKS